MADPSAEVLPTLLQYDEASGGKHKDVVVREVSFSAYTRHVLKRV